MSLRFAPFHMKNFCAHRLLHWWFRTGVAMFVMCGHLSPSNAQVSPRQIEIGVIPGGLRYNVTEFEAAVGEFIELTLDNNGLIPHNWLLVQSGKLQDVINAAVALGGSGLSKDFIPQTPDILQRITLVQPGKSISIQFRVPEKIGDYPYVCTFPGHSNLMRGVMKVVGKSDKVSAPLTETSSRRLALDALGRSKVQPFPEGTREKPYIIRTFMPEPDLAPEVLANHDRGYVAANYNPGQGKDVPGIALTDQGLPAAIGVHFGEPLSICWDTVECRLMYAWNGGFLDMSHYWGKGAGGSRKGFDYVSRLIGKIQFKTQGTHPLNANYHQGTIPPVPRYRGYKLFNGTPEFIYTFGPYTVHERVTPSGNKAVQFDYSIRAMQNDSLIRFGLDPAIRPSVESSIGHWEGNELLLTAEEARKFQLVLRYD